MLHYVTLSLQPCTTTGLSTSSLTVMECKAPSLNGIEGLQLPVESRIGLLMDGVTSLLDLNTTVIVHQNPVIEEFDRVLEFREGNMIMLTITVSV